MAPKRRLKEKRDEQIIGQDHGIEPAFDEKVDTSLKVLRSSSRLREKELKHMEGKDTHKQIPTSINPKLKKNLASFFEVCDTKKSNQVEHVNMKSIGVDKKPAKGSFQEKKADKDETGQAKKEALKKADYVDSCKEPEQVVASNNTHSMAPLPYVEVFLPDGRLARQCRASNECSGKFHFETVRWRMERHLKKEHGLEVHIPLRKVGRPSKTESSRDNTPQPRVEKIRWHKLSKKRFEDKDRKFALNLKKTEELHRLRAKEKWAKLKPEFRTLSQEEFVEKIVKEHMSAYLASSRERMLGIQKRINEGYDQHRRVKVLPAWFNVMMDDIEEEKKMYTKKGKEPEVDESNEEGSPWDGKSYDRESTKEEESFDLQVDEGSKEEEEMFDKKSNKSSISFCFGDMPQTYLPKPTDAKDNLLLETQNPLVKANTLHSVDTFGDFATMSVNIDVKNDEGLIMKHRQKLPIRPAKNTRVLIDVCSPPRHSRETHASHKFIIENGLIKVVEEVDGRVVTSRANIATARLQSNAEITFTSKRFKLLVDIDESLLNGILHDHANSRTINLFGQWMEHILPSSILKKVYFVDALWYTMPGPVITKFLLEQFTGVDFSELVFCFWPIICRHHWSLFVLYVNRGIKVLDFPGKKHYLLYFDSLGLTSPFECLDSMQRALRCLAEIVGDVCLRHALLNIKAQLELKIMDAPQQPNGSDCGFYVMKYIRDLIAGGLGDQPASKTWLTKDWFEHKDVCQMKQEFHDWCMQCLTEI